MYVDLNYKPKNDIVCDFFLEPNKISVKDAAEQVAAESSVGTWTKVHTEKKYMKNLAARVFEIRGNNIKIAYPLDLFEYGNIPQLLSSVAGNIFGMKTVKNLRLNDIHFPDRYIKSFSGPKFGIAGIRKITKTEKRPLVGTIIKPKLGLRTNDHAKVAFDAWIGGCDIVKDDENLTSQHFNSFEKRIIETLKMRDKAEKITGEKKIYMPNITAETNEMIKRARFVKKHGGDYIMIDIITCGFSSLQTVRDEGLVIHAHRAMHAAITRNIKHGISMKVIAKLSRLAGVDQLHIGTMIGKMEGEDVLDVREACIEKIPLKPVFPVCSGGLNPSHVPELVKMLGNNIIIQMGGGIHGHPDGTKSGAKAARQVVDAVMKKIPLKEYAKNHSELKTAIEKWGFVR